MWFERMILYDYLALFRTKFFNSFDQKHNHYKIYVDNHKWLNTLTLYISQKWKFCRKKNVDMRVQTLDKSICEDYSTTRLKTHIANICPTLNISMNRSRRFNWFFFLFSEGNSTLPLLYFNCLPIQSPRHGWSKSFFFCSN